MGGVESVGGWSRLSPWADDLTAGSLENSGSLISVVQLRF